MADKESYRPSSPPRVMIVGGGVAGVFLAILLDRANIPYEIYERAASVKQLGMVQRQTVSLHSTLLEYYGF